MPLRSNCGGVVAVPHIVVLEHEDKERVANMETIKVKEMERLEVAGGRCCKTFKSLNADPILFFSMKTMFQRN